MATELSSNLKLIQQLDYDQREEAYETARVRMAGTQTDIARFRKGSVGKYPRRLVILAYVLLIGLMMAAFVPSAISLFHSGNREFCRSLFAVRDGSVFTNNPISEKYDPSDPACQAAGAAEVAMAEIGQLVFLISLSILDRVYHEATIRGRKFSYSTTSVILWCGAIISMIISLAGNLHFNQPWRFGNWVFDYVKTLSPPFLVMGIGYTLKEMFLTTVRDNFETVAKYNAAEADRIQRYNDPESSPSWNRFFSVALREAIIKRNATPMQRKALKELLPDEWRYVIRREYKAMDWAVDLDVETPIEKQEEVRIATLAGPAIGQGKSTFDSSTNKKDGGTYQYWINPDGTWSGYSKIHNRLLGEDYSTSQNAYHAIYAANKKAVNGAG